MINFVAYYLILVKAGKITIEKVPAKYREAVKERLECAHTRR